MENHKMTRTVAQALAQALRRHGVEEVFGQSLPSTFFLAAEEIGIRQIVYRTENAGGAMADAYARVTNRIAVVGAQNGPAAALLVAPLAEALKASVPVLALVQEVSVATRDKNAFQELDHRAIFGGCTKIVRELLDPARVDEYVDLLITTATTGRPGPVVLLLPKEILAAPVPEQAPRRTHTLGTYPLDPVRAEADRVDAAARLLAEASAPLVIAGGGVHLSRATQELAQLQERASLPVATTNMGKGSVDEGHPLSMGVIGNAMGKWASSHHLRSMIDDADVILIVGSRTNENGTDVWRLIPASAKVIHLDIDGVEVGRNYEAEVRLVGDARVTLVDLLARLEETGLSARDRRRDDVVNAISAARAAHREAVRVIEESDDSPIRPERVMAELDRVLTPTDIVVADASYSTLWLTGYVRAKAAGQRFLTPRGLAGLGWGVPFALGAKAGAPDRTVYCITGDGGFGHVWSELETAARAGLPVVIVLLNNSILGFQKHSELVQYGAHTSAIEFTDVDHAAIARAAGVNAIRVSDPAKLSEALRDAAAAGEPRLIEVMTSANATPPITHWDDHEEILAAHEV